MALQFILKLYISGKTPRSHRAIANIQAFCQRELPQNSKVEIIDLIEFPEIAEAQKILITPTLIKESPLPQERIIGDLSNKEVLYFALNIYPQSFEPKE